MSFKKTGSLFDDFSEVFLGTYKGFGSLDDMDNLRNGLFKNSFKIGSDGVSEFTMEQIQARAAAMGLTEELTAQTVAMAKDADFTAKARTKKLTWKKAIEDSTIGVDDLYDTLKSKNKLKKKDFDILDSIGQDFGKDSKQYRNRLSSMIDAAGIADDIIDIGDAGVKASSGVKNLRDTFVGLAGSIGSFVSANAAFLGVTAVVVAGLAAVHSYVTAFDDAMDKASNSLTAYQSEASDLQSLQSELSTTSERIAELKSQGTLTITEESELANLQRQNAELERQVELKQQSVEKSAEQSVEDATRALELERTQDLTTKTTTTGRMDQPVDHYETTDILTATENEIDALEEMYQKRESLNKEYNDTDTSKKRKKAINDEIASLEASIESYDSAISKNIENISQLRDSFIDPLTGTAIKGSEDMVKRIDQIIDGYNNVDLSPIERQAKQIESAFSATSGNDLIRDQLIEAAKSGEDVVDVLHEMGLTLSDLGIKGAGKGDAVRRYFDELAESAEQAQDAINSVDGSVEGVTAAFESANQDADWKTMSDYLSQASELYQQGKVGTDDFQTATQFMTYDTINADADGFKYDADAYVHYWEQAQGKVARYFDENNPIQSVSNALEDLKKAGLATELEGGDNDWTDSFRTSADAAKAWGVSVDAAEAMMHNMESYGAEFDDVFWSGEGLSRYEEALTNLKTIRDDMSSGNEKDRLSGLIEGWDEEYAQYQNDLSGLTEDQVVRIEFEYDLASIQQQIDELDELWAAGDRSAETGAKRIAARQNRLDLLEEETGYTEEDSEGYAGISEKQESISKALAKTDNEELIGEYQDQISALSELQSTFQEAFLDGETANWDEWLNSDGFGEAIENILDNTNLDEDQLSELLNMSPEELDKALDLKVDADVEEAQSKINGIISEDGKTITMNADANTEEVQYALDNLQEGQTLKFTADADFSNVEYAIENMEEGQTIEFTAEVDGESQVITALKDEGGEIHYTAVIDNEEVELTKEGKVFCTAEVTDVDTSGAGKADIDATANVTDTDTSGANNVTLDANANVTEADTSGLAGQLISVKAQVTGGLDTSTLGTPTVNVQPQLLPTSLNLAAQTLQANVGIGSVDPIPTQQATANVSLGTYPKTIPTLTGVANVSLGTYPTTIPAATQTVYRNYVNINSGDGGLTGTAHASGTVLDSDWINPNWRTKQGEIALTGEKAQELVVDPRTNKWWTVGDRGAEFSYIPPGAVIFNGQQTKQLLTNGSINSRGTGPSYLSGTAYANGFRFPSGGSAGSSSTHTSSSSSNKGSSSASSSATKAANSAAKAASSASSAASSTAKAADEFKEKFDEVEIWLDRFDRTLNNLTDSIETYSYDLSKQSSVSDQAMNHIRNNLSTLQSAYNRYIQEANSVGLDESWAAKVRNGAINLEDITDEDLKEKIDNYQSYYEKALDVEDTIAELQRELVDLATEKLDNIEQYYENRSDYDDNFGYLTSIEQLATALETYQKELDKQVNDGIIKEFSNEWYEAQSSIAEMQQNLFEAMLKKYQDIVDNLDRISTTLDNSLSLKDARDEPITEEDYQRPLEVANEQIDSLFEKRQKLLEQQAIYDVGSELYDDLADQISDIDDDIFGLLEDIEDLKDKIWEVRWQPFFDGQEALADLIDETDEFRDLLHDDAFIGEFGGLTTEGLTNVALISQSMNASKQQIKNYSAALEKLNEDLQAGNISTSEFEEQQKDFLEAIREGTLDVSNYQEEIISLWQEMIEKENDVVQSSIDKHKELLQAKKDNDDYSRNVRDQTKEINALEAQIKALESVKQICRIHFNCWEALRIL